jgi:hypothetical protein
LPASSAETPYSTRSCGSGLWHCHWVLTGAGGGEPASRKKLLGGAVALVKVIELLAATLVLSATQLTRLAEACSTLVLPTVKPVASNRNWPPSLRGDWSLAQEVGAAPTLIVPAPRPSSSW